MKTLNYIIENGQRISDPLANHYVQHHTAKFITGKIPKYEYHNASWNWNGRQQKLISSANGVIYVPRHCVYDVISGVHTILPRNWRTARGCVKCWTVENSRGYSQKLVPGFLHCPTETHGKTAHNARRDGRTKLVSNRAAIVEAKKLESAQHSQKIVNLVDVSRASGNCLAGTESFISRLFEGYKRSPRFAKIGAIVRIAKRRNLYTPDFRRALSVATK